MSDDARARLDPHRTELGRSIARSWRSWRSGRRSPRGSARQARAGMPTRDYRQERDVVQRARAAAVEHGLPASLGEELMLALIRGSLTVQEKDTVAASGEGSRPARARDRRCRSHGALVRALPRCPGVHGRDRGSARRCRTASINHRDWPAVDARSRADRRSRRRCRRPRQILEAMAAAPPTGVVFDVGSLKSPLRKGLRALRAAGGQVTSVHPMFGPDTELLSGRHVIFVDVGVPRRPPRRARCSSRRWRRSSRWISRATIG